MAICRHSSGGCVVSRTVKAGKSYLLPTFRAAFSMLHDAGRCLTCSNKAETIDRWSPYSLSRIVYVCMYVCQLFYVVFVISSPSCCW